jgi:hypothetical protein
LTDDALLRVTGWARDGLTDEQVAHNMGIGYSTFREWLNKYPALLAALKKGKAPVDIEVENALLKRALGYEYEEVCTEVEEIPFKTKDENGNTITITKTKKHIRKTTKMVVPDVTAQIFWLKNRRPGKWRDKIEAAPETANELLQSLFDLERRSES